MVTKEMIKRIKKLEKQEKETQKRIWELEKQHIKIKDEMREITGIATGDIMNASTFLELLYKTQKNN